MKPLILMSVLFFTSAIIIDTLWHRSKINYRQATILWTLVAFVFLGYMIYYTESETPPPPQEIPPLERFLSGEEVELRDILHNLYDSGTLPSLVKLWAAKNFPDRRPDEVCRAVIGEIYRAKVKMVLPASIAENVAAKFAEESVPSASTPTAPNTALTPTPLSTSAPTPNTEASTATENSMATVLCGPFRIIETPLIAFGKLIKGDSGAVLKMPHNIQDQVEVMMRGAKSVITSDDTPSPK